MLQNKHNVMINKRILEDKKNLVVLLFYTFLLLLFCSKMSPLYPINEGPDVNLYFNVGKAMMNGKTLYSDVFDHKGPFIFIIYGIGYLISNSSFLGVFIIELFLWCGMATIAYLAARVYLDKLYSFIVTVVFLSFMLTQTNEGGSAEEFIAIFQLISLFLFVKFFKERTPSQHKPLYMLIHGIMFGLVLFTKINLTVFWVFPLGGVLIYLLQKKAYTNLIYNILSFMIGLLLVALPIIVYLWINDSLAEFWNTYIVLNRSYANIGSVSEVMTKIIGSLYLRLRFDTFPFLLILLGAIYFPIKYIKNRIGSVVLILSFVTLYAAIFVTPRFIYYYSLPYYIYGLLGLIVLAHYIRINESWRVYVICAVLALWWGISKKDFFGLQMNELFSVKREKASYDRFADIIAQEENPTLMNLNLNQYAVIFTKLNIIPSIKYFISPNITYDIYPEMRDEQTKYIENKSIQFIIMSENAPDFKYFNALPPMEDNYMKIDSLPISDTKRVYLYKRLD